MIKWFHRINRNGLFWVSGWNGNGTIKFWALVTFGISLISFTFGILSLIQYALDTKITTDYFAIKPSGITCIIFLVTFVLLYTISCFGIKFPQNYNDEEQNIGDKSDAQEQKEA